MVIRSGSDLLSSATPEVGSVVLTLRQFWNPELHHPFHGLFETQKRPSVQNSLESCLEHKGIH